RKKMSRIGCLLLTMIFGAALFAGCGEQADTQEPGAPAPDRVGRYVGIEIPLPEEVPISYLSYFQRSPQGELQFFYCPEKSESGPYRCATLQQDDSWQVQEAAAVNDALAQIPGAAMRDIRYGNDGKLYVGVSSPDGGNAVFCCEGEKAQEIELNYVNGVNTYLGGVYGLSDGSIVLDCGTIEKYERSTGNLELTIDVYQNAGIGREDQLYYFKDQSAKEQGIISKLILTGELEVGDLPFCEIEKPGALVHVFDDGNEGTVCAAGSSLSYLAPGATIWEKLTDSQYGVFSYSGFQIRELYPQNDDYVATAFYDHEALHCLRIKYDEVAAENQVLVIAGMEEPDERLQNSIAAFQTSHPSVKVEYRQLVGEDGYATADEARKVLNTEILADEGPDLLLWDAADLKGYEGKGVLLPLEELLKDVKEELIPGIWETSMDENGNIYALPTAFYAWTLLADETVTEAFTSLHDLAAYAKAHPDTPVLPASDWTASGLVKMLLQLYEDEFYAEDGSFDPQRAQTFLEDAFTLAQQIGCGEWKQDLMMGADTNSSIVARTQGEALASLTRQKDMPDSFTTMLINLYTGLCYNEDAKLSIVKNGYLPLSCIGVNANSENTELAAEFAAQMLRTSDIWEQYPESATKVRGASVNRKVLEKATALTALAIENLTEYGMLDMSQVEGHDYFLRPASEKETQPIAELFYGVDTRLWEDARLEEIIMPCIKDYFEGTITAQEAAENMSAQMKVALSE
ncbi:MAG: hypothetical protein Q4G07_06705, partial [Oscillospiraceae bacterium]|nr:hypothetical protein [Oscillospiraceae bacterium]